MRSEMTKTKRSAAKQGRVGAAKTVEDWRQEQGATESVTFDEKTGAAMRTFTIDLTRGG